MSNSADDRKRTLQHPEAACDGKFRFESAALAREVARRSRKRGATKRSHYRCGNCGGWHVGQTGASVSQQMKRERKYVQKGILDELQAG